MSFDARTRELLDELGKLPYPGREVGTVDEVVEREREQKGLKDAIASYGASRTQHLDRLVEIMKETSPDHIQAEQWFLAALDAKDDAGRTLGNAFRETKTPTIIGIAFITKATLAETKFWDSISKAKDAADARDSIARYRKELAEKIDVLDRKWSELMSQHQSFEKDQEEAIADVESLVKEAAERVAMKNKSAREQALIWAEELAKAAAFSNQVPGGEAGGLLVDIVEKGAAWLREKLADYECRVARYQQSFRTERGSVLVLFKDFHVDCEDFVKKHGYDGVLQWVENGRRALVEIRSSGSETSGLQSDAEALFSACFPLLESARDEAKQRWEDFVRKNEKKFFGPVGPEIEKAIIGSAEWEDRYKRIAGLDLQRVLENWLNDARSKWGVDLGKIPDDRRESFTKALEIEIQKVVAAEEAAKSAVSLEKLHEAIMRDREDAKNDLPR